MKIVMFKTPKPKKFTIKTRYYDEEKEALEKRKKEREKRLSGEVGASIKGGLSKNRKQSSLRKRSLRSLFIYIIFLLLLLYYILY